MGWEFFQIFVSAHHSTVKWLAAARVLVNVHPLLSEWDALHHRRAVRIEEIGAPGRDSARLEREFRKAGRVGGGGGYGGDDGLCGVLEGFGVLEGRTWGDNHLR